MGLSAPGSAGMLRGGIVLPAACWGWGLLLCCRGFAWPLGVLSGLRANRRNLQQLRQLWGRTGEEKFTGNILNAILLLRGKFGLLVIFSESVQVVLCGQALTAAMCLGEAV